jgi:AcrR family transcriptional regulator
MDSIAARAGTSKGVMYRRWTSKSELIMAALQRQSLAFPPEAPDTGSLRSDLLAVLRPFVQRFNRMGQQAIFSLISYYHGDPEFLAYVQQLFIGSSYQAMASVLQRAVARGEVHPDKVTPRITRLPVDLVRYDALNSRKPFTMSGVEEVIDEIVLPLIRTEQR